MYAGKITLIGTEHGVGARNAGTIMAADGSGPLSGPGEFIITADGRLENIGTIQAARRAAIGAESLANSGRITSGGELKIATRGTLGNAGGTLEAQSLQLASGTDIDNRGGAMRQTSGAGLTIKAPILSNTAGGVIGAEPVPETTPAQPGTGTGSGGTGISDPATPDIGTGTGTGTGDATIALPREVPTPGTITAAGSILNDAGRVYAGGPIQLQTSQVTNNSGSLSTTSLAVSGPSFSNVGGTVHVAQGFSANVDRLDNTGGTVRAGSMQIASAGDLINSNGTLDSRGDATLSAGGAIDNSRGSITAARHASLTAARVQGAGVLGAGIQADDRLGSAGDLRVTTTDALAANGTTLAAGDSVLQGASIDLSSSTTSAGSISLTATQGKVITSAASVTTPGTLSVTATANAEQALVNDSGQLHAGQLDLRASNIANTHGGEILQTGNGATRIEVSGALANDAGTIASNGNTTVSAGSLSNQGGTIASNGTATLTAGSLRNDSGRITAAGDLSATVAGAATNIGGTLAANGSTTFTADTLDNTRGSVAAVHGQLRVATAGQTVNAAGKLQAGGAAVLANAGLVNTEGQVTGSSVSVDTRGHALANMDAGGKLSLLTQSTTSAMSRREVDNDAAFSSASGSGRTDETTQYNRFDVKDLGIQAAGGVKAQLGANASLSMLAQQPGMAWVNQLANDPAFVNSVEWQRVKEEHDRWSYHQSGMGPVTALVVSVVAAAVAAPIAAQAGAAAGGAATSAGMGATVSAGTNAAVQAGVSALASRAAVSLVNNDGDLGRVLQEMGSSDAVKGIVTSMLTAGVVQGLNETIGLSAPTAQLSWQQQLGRNVADGAASALVRSAINATSLEDELRSALANALLTTAATQSANAIALDTGEGAALNRFASELAHAIAGCAVGSGRASAAGGAAGDGCAAGALGAVAGHLFAQFAGESLPLDQAVQLSRLIGGLSAAIAGGDERSIYIGAAAGENAAENNFGYLLALAPRVSNYLERAVRFGASTLSSAETALVDRCISSTACFALLPAGAAATWAVGTQMAAHQPSLADQIPTGYGAGGVRVLNGSASTPADVVQGENTTATPGVALNDSGTPGYSASSPSTGGTSTPNNGPMGGLAMMAVPIGDRNAFDKGLTSAMGTQPIPERATNSSNEIGRYPSGTWADANRAFDAMPLSGVRVVGTTPIGDIRYGTLPDGTAVIVRPNSSDGAPTIQIQDSNRPSGRPVTVREIRFGPPR
ncbi:MULTISPECIES: DUF637 domain-containing protein [unclassified Variovorax]|nr:MULTISPECIES: DUF637 domain-containing protein [unclassified Variovorax]PNG58783.1 tRNA nuclease CdiA-2 [Variovorax sp. B4]PNG61427.1 tRNA nuclease CdiA-2 [Variovorax sp. B2]